MTKKDILNLKNLTVSFKNDKKSLIHIVRGVDIKVKESEIVGLVGESGSGKSVTTKSLLNLNMNDVTNSDQMEINDKELSSLSKKE